MHTYTEVFLFSVSSLCRGPYTNVDTSLLFVLCSVREHITYMCPSWCKCKAVKPGSIVKCSNVHDYFPTIYRCFYLCEDGWHDDGCHNDRKYDLNHVKVFILAKKWSIANIKQAFGLRLYQVWNIICYTSRQKHFVKRTAQSNYSSHPAGRTLGH